MSNILKLVIALVRLIISFIVLSVTYVKLGTLGKLKIGLRIGFNPHLYDIKSGDKLLCQGTIKVMGILTMPPSLLTY